MFVHNPIRSFILSRSIRTASLGEMRSAFHSYFISSEFNSSSSLRRFAFSSMFAKISAVVFAQAILIASSSSTSGS